MKRAVKVSVKLRVKKKGKNAERVVCRNRAWICCRSARAEIKNERWQPARDYPRMELRRPIR